MTGYRPLVRFCWLIGMTERTDARPFDHAAGFTRLVLLASPELKHTKRAQPFCGIDATAHENIDTRHEQI